MISAKPGPRIMPVQLGCGLLFGISITLLKDSYGSFLHAIHLEELIVAAFIPPVEDVSVKFVPLSFEDIFFQIHE
jgi:hypothetical protein